MLGEALLLLPLRSGDRRQLPESCRRGDWLSLS